MSVKKFIAKTSREALNQIRAELGADAVILTNRQNGEHVELLALAQHDLAGLMAAPPMVKAGPPKAQTAAPVKLKQPSAASEPSAIDILTRRVSWPATHAEPSVLLASRSQRACRDQVYARHALNSNSLSLHGTRRRGGTRTG